MSAADLHPQVPEIDEIVPVLYVRGRDDQLLLLPCLLTIVGVPEEPHHSLEGQHRYKIAMRKNKKKYIYVIYQKKSIKNMQNFWWKFLRNNVQLISITSIRMSYHTIVCCGMQHVNL